MYHRDVSQSALSEHLLDRTTALVTGASSGIGRAMARQLAARGADVVITARRAAVLEALATELRVLASKAKVTVIPLDLSSAAAAAELYERTEGAGMTIDVLINNAGAGTHQEFIDIPWEKSAQQLQLNITSLTELSYRFGRAMAARRRGHILNVGSIGAYLPCPGYATYAAGKAYVRNFTEALAHELADRGVRVCCLCPGGTETEFQSAAGQPIPAWQKPLFMSADRCARIGLSALFGGRRNVVSGWFNKIGMWMLRFVPRRLMVWIGSVAMGKPTKALSSAEG